MLQELYVKNLAVVEEAHIVFQPGLNVITGETGAGKSVLMGAISLLLGDRADRSTLRAGTDHCSVRGAFALADSSDVDGVLEELGLTPCEDGMLIIRREIGTTSGKNYVNDCPTTTQTLRRLGELLVDTHGPHEHQSLLRPTHQLDLLDAFGHTWRARAAYEQHYEAYVELLDKLDKLESVNEKTVAEEMDALAYHIAEIESAELDGLDEDALIAEHRAAANASTILASTYTATQRLGDGEVSAFEQLVEAQRQLGRLENILVEAKNWHREAEDLALRVQELSVAIERRAAAIDADPERLQWLEERMALLQKLKRKYGGSLDGIRAHLETSRERYRELTGRNAQIMELRAKLKHRHEEMMTAGGALSLERGEAAGALGKTITTHLKFLGLQHAAFSVDVSQGKMTASGLDIVEFAFAPNIGEPMRPLRSIASSGEISRVMLAAKVALADHDHIPLMVFDEIDANIGGEMGTAVGEKLRAVAETHQVICITHLPQVAVFGRTHLVVTKTVHKGRTLTNIEPVDDNDRAEEIARMLGGKDSTTVVLDHAREMLTIAAQKAQR